MKFTCGVVTVSDRCYNSTAEDRSGPSLISALEESFSDAIITHKMIVPDDHDHIVASLQKLCENNVNLILTTGGTGLSKRDVTPEATKKVIEKEVPGITQTMLIRSLDVTDMAMLSRAVAGIKLNSLIINLPGSSKGALECFGFIKSVIPHAISLILNLTEDIEITHKKLKSVADEKGELQGKCDGSKVQISQVAKRNRTSPYKMISFDEALTVVRAQSVHLEHVEEVSIENSLNRVLAEDIISNQPFPPFKASIKDGYAVRAADGQEDRIVKAAMAAGDDPLKSPLQPNEAVRISTGACVPEGADAVVQVEDTELIESDDKGNELKIRVKVLPVTGKDIRAIGSDISENTLVFERAETITPGHIGVFATLGYLTIKVYKRPSIGIFSTGSELCPYNAKEIPHGHVRDSNKITLLNLLQKYGYKATDCGIVKDEPDMLKKVLTTAFRKHDVIITTGGVSMGEFDLIKDVLKIDFNANIHFGRVNMKPGKPTTFATCRFEGCRKLIFALPGNPVSAMVTCRLFVIPGLQTYECSRKDCCEKINIFNESSIIPDDRMEFKRVRLAKGTNKTQYLWGLEMGDQISSRLNSCAGADALMIVPPSNKQQQKYLSGTILSAYIL